MGYGYNWMVENQNTIQPKWIHSEKVRSDPNRNLAIAILYQVHPSTNAKKSQSCSLFNLLENKWFVEIFLTNLLKYCHNCQPYCDNNNDKTLSSLVLVFPMSGANPLPVRMPIAGNLVLRKKHTKHTQCRSVYSGILASNVCGTERAMKPPDNGLPPWPFWHLVTTLCSIRWAHSLLCCGMFILPCSFIRFIFPKSSGSFFGNVVITCASDVSQNS